MDKKVSAAREGERGTSSVVTSKGKTKLSADSIVEVVSKPKEEILKRGSLKKQGQLNKRRWKKRWYALRENGLEESKKTGIFRKELQKKTKMITIAGSTVCTSAHAVFAFKLRTRDGQTYHLQARDQDDCADWISKLQRLSLGAAGSLLLFPARRKNILDYPKLSDIINNHELEEDIYCLEEMEQRIRKSLCYEIHKVESRLGSADGLMDVIYADKRIRHLGPARQETLRRDFERAISMITPAGEGTSAPHPQNQGGVYSSLDKEVDEYTLAYYEGMCHGSSVSVPTAIRSSTESYPSVQVSPKHTSKKGKRRLREQRYSFCEILAGDLLKSPMGKGVMTREYGSEYNDASNKMAGQWDQRFRACLEDMQRFTINTPPGIRCDVMKRLINLAQDFIYVATTFGKIIIAELYLDVNQKSIKPIEIGGFAGGAKYRVHNIIFKFAWDNNNLYGSNEAAAKVAGHELKGCISYFNCVTTWVKDLNVPMMALVDYRGFRLIAMSGLPIDGTTIVYGSNDAGRTVHTGDAVLNAKLEHCAKVLNIKSRVVGDGFLWSPVDMEGHKCKAGKYYLVDFARCFPPESPAIPRIRGGNLYRLLRPEFVRNYHRPLCPDAHTGFLEGEPEQVRHKLNETIDQASKYLLEQLIPQLAESLPGNVHRVQISGKEALQQYVVCSKISQTLHRHGINLRHMGQLRGLVRDPLTRTVLLVEMISRVLKQLLNAQLRRKHEELGGGYGKGMVAVEQPYRLLVLDFFNLCLGNSSSSRKFWNSSLKEALTKKYVGGLSKAEEASGLLNALEQFPEGIDGRLLLFRLIQRMTGVEFSADVVQHFAGDRRWWDGPDPLDLPDLLQIGVRVKHMNIVSYASGYMYMLRGFEAFQQNRSRPAKKLLALALTKFEDALNTPIGRVICHQVMLEQGSADKFPPNLPEVERAKDLFLRAIRANPMDSYPLFRYAQFLWLNRRKNEAEDYFLHALECDPNNTACLEQYAQLLEEMEISDRHLLAERFRERSRENIRYLETSGQNWDQGRVDVPLIVRRLSVSGKSPAPSGEPRVPQAQHQIEGGLPFLYSHYNPPAGKQKEASQDAGVELSANILTPPGGPPAPASSASSSRTSRKSPLKKSSRAITFHKSDVSDKGSVE